MSRSADSKLSVLVVWEPILSTDWTRPSKSTLARIRDKRARQFWDPNHLVAAALNDFAKQKPDQPHPRCCVEKGFHWDEAILYAPGSQWKDAPVARFWDGPIVRAMTGFETAFKEQQVAKPGTDKSAFKQP